MLTSAVITVTLALLLYTTGTFLDIFSKKVKLPAYLFTAGLLCDIASTIMMSLISEGFTLDAHGISGLTVLFLMLLKTIYIWKLISLKNYKKSLNGKIITFILWAGWASVYIHGAMVH